MIQVFNREGSSLMDKKIEKHFTWTAHPKELDTSVHTWGVVNSQYWYTGFNKRGKQVCMMSADLFNLLKGLS